MSRVLKREWSTAEGWRDTKAGMWAWLIQRAAAVALLLVIALHLVNPFRRGVQAALLALALVHALLGVRAILLDFGLACRWPRAVRARPGALGGGLRRGLGVAVVLSYIGRDDTIAA